MNYVQIRAYDNYVNAHIGLSQLKQEGIDCHLKDEYTIAVDPFLSNALGGMKLMVTEEDWENANEILDESERRFLKTIPCPKCKQNELKHIVHVNKPQGFLNMLKFRLINGQDSEILKYYECGNCGSCFDELPNNG